MNILSQFESLAEQALFSSNKENILQLLGLADTFKDKNSQNLRALLANNSEDFADMSRVTQ